MGDGAGKYWPVNQTKNKSINRDTFTQFWLMILPRHHANDTLQHEVCYKARNYRPKDTEGIIFDCDTHADTRLLGQGFRVINTHTYECNISGL